tara:strand:+ start:7229 stop:8203 length:975 start_codon:yes stop_codon:yes gene_type:complete
MDYRQFKKVELHRHFEACARLTSLAEMANMGLQEAATHFQIHHPMKSLEEVIQRFVRTVEYFRSYEVLERIAYEACEDAALENIRILELRYAPSFIGAVQKLDFQKIHDAILKGVQKAEKDFPIAVGFIGIIVRSQSMLEAEKSLDFFLHNKDSFLAIDLADQEVGFDCRNFATLFSKAREHGLRVTCHSGEENVAEAPQFVKNAIDILGAERIGHGLQIIHDQNIMQYVKEKNIVLELCPTSNFLTNNWPDLASHPLKQLYEYGIACTINSDDPVVFNIDLSHEWKIAHENMGIHLGAIHGMQETAYRASFLPEAKKTAIWQS